MVEEGRALATLHERVVVKVPFSARACRHARAVSDGIRVNMTLVFSATQALLTAQAGATYASCFMGRLDDISVTPRPWSRRSSRRSGRTATRRCSPPRSAIRARRDRGPARLRGRDHPGQGLQADARHPLTEAGSERFEDDWKSRPEFGQWLRGLVDERATAKS